MRTVVEVDIIDYSSFSLYDSLFFNLAKRNIRYEFLIIRGIAQLVLVRNYTNIWCRLTRERDVLDKNNYWVVVSNVGCYFLLPNSAEPYKSSEKKTCVEIIFPWLERRLIASRKVLQSRINWFELNLRNCFRFKLLGIFR